MQYWLRVSGTGEGPIDSDWWTQGHEWRTRFGNVSMFSRRPRIVVGDMLVLYAAGSPHRFGAGRVYGVTQATSDPMPSPRAVAVDG